MTVQANRQGLFLGWLPNATSLNTFANNAAANWYALSFLPNGSRTLSEVSTFVSAKAGTLAGSDVVCDLYDSTGASGVPGASIETGKTPTATITASGWYRWTGFTTALTSGTPYWAVWRNVNGVPATNNCTFRNLSSYTGWPSVAGSASYYWGSANSTNSGVAWGTSAGQTCLRLGYADGTYDGVIFSNVAAAAVGDGVYATRESGVKFTSPANGILNVIGVVMRVGTKTGSPTGNFRFGIWTGSSPANQGYTNALPSSMFVTNGILYGVFSSPIAIQPSTIVRVTAAETAQADASTNRFNMGEYTPDSDSNSTPLLPFNGTATKTYFDGSIWTDATLGTSLFGFGLLLDPAGEFGSSGGGGGVMGSRIFGGF